MPVSPLDDSKLQLGGAGGAPRVLLRLEGAMALVVAVVAYRYSGGNGGQFALLFLAPDLSMAGYLFGPRPGAVIYNAAHTYLVPAVFALVALLLPPDQSMLMFRLAAIWAAHIGMDRALGFGLKYGTAFTSTHLGSSRKST